jgi:hypothetical protein
MGDTITQAMASDVSHHQQQLPQYRWHSVPQQLLGIISTHPTSKHQRKGTRAMPLPSGPAHALRRKTLEQGHSIEGQLIRRHPLPNLINKLKTKIEIKYNNQFF